MEKKEFQSIHEIGYTSLLKILENYRGIDSDEVTSGVRDSSTSVELKDFSNQNLLLAASGIFMEGVHFDLIYTPLQHLGFKLVSAVTSKIYAMNGTPLKVQIDIAVPNKVSVEMTRDIFSGFDRAGKEYDCTIVPGDTTASYQGLVISLHVTGTVSKKDVIHRSGARPGDQVCVTGDLGGAMAGLRILLKEKKFWLESGKDNFQPELQDYEYVVQRQLLPKSRVDFNRAMISAAVRPTAMIELSKGLLNELQLIAEINGVGCEIFTPAVPISLETRKVADELEEDVDRYAFYGGEDYEVLFTIGNQDIEKLRSEFEDFSVIGEIKPESEGILLNTGEGKSVDIRKEQ